MGVAGLGLGLLLILGGPCGSSETLVPVQVQVKVQVQVRAQVRVQVQLPGVMCVYLNSVSQSFPHGHACVCSSHTSEYIFLPVLPCEGLSDVWSVVLESSSGSFMYSGVWAASMVEL